MDIFTLLVIGIMGLFGYLSARWYEQAVLLVVAILPAYLLRFTAFGIPTNVFEVAVGITFISGLLLPAVFRKWQVAWRTLPRAAKMLVGLFILAAIISTAVSPHLHTSLGILKSWIIVPILLGWQVYGMSNMKVAVGRYRADVVDALIVSGVVMALVGISQMGVLVRVQGVYDVPNSLALFLAPISVLALGRYLSTGSRPYANATLGMVVAILATQSLAGILAVGVTMLGIGMSSGHRKGFLKLSAKTVLTFIVLASIAGYMGLQKVEYLKTPGSSAYVRLQLWSVAGELVQESPLLGVGLGTFEPAYQNKLHERFIDGFQNSILEFVFRDPHNWVLSFWLNMGLLGLIVFIGLHVYALTRPREWTAAHWALVCLLVFGLVDTIYWKNDLAALQWVLVAVAVENSENKS